MSSPFRSAWLPRGWTWAVLLAAAVVALYAWSQGFAHPAVRFATWEARAAWQQLVGGPTAASSASSYRLPPGCGPAARRFRCNPLDNRGCRPGAACDDDGNGGFRCYAAPALPAGAACDDNAGSSCIPGFACDSGAGPGTVGVCRKFCCKATDCPGDGRCITIDPDFGSLGFCH